jgi:glycosyltransferase involved in cell wall biosynthesis
MSVSTGADAYKSAYKIGVTVPAYNEERLVGETLKGIPEYVDGIYVVDDYSTDKTGEVVKSSTDPRVVLIKHVKNKGVGGAIATGYKKALEDGMDIVVVMAGDNPVEVDTVCSIVMGFDPKKIPMLKYAMDAEKYRLYDGDPTGIRIASDQCQTLANVYDVFNCALIPPKGWIGHIEYEDRAIASDAAHARQDAYDALEGA